MGWKGLRTYKALVALNRKMVLPLFRTMKVCGQRATIGRVAALGPYGEELLGGSCGPRGLEVWQRVGLEDEERACQRGGGTGSWKVSGSSHLWLGRDKIEFRGLPGWVDLVSFQ